MRPNNSSDALAPRAQIRVCYGGLRRQPPAAPIKRMTAAEREKRAALVTDARAHALAGDDSELRALIDIRYAVECFTNIGGPFGETLPGGQYGRKRKFSNPLFLTPYGLLEAYPERDADLFVCSEVAQNAIHALQRGGEWEIRETLLTMEMCKKPYLRWLKEVKAQDYSEPRRSLEELAEIYRQGGRSALSLLYTRSHVSKTISKLREQGVEIRPEDLDKAGFA